MEGKAPVIFKDIGLLVKNKKLQDQQTDDMVIF